MAAKKKTAKKRAARKRGRPTLYNKRIAQQIVERVAGGEPLEWICRDPGMPKVRTVSYWRERHPEFFADFARARQEGADALACQCLEIADDAVSDPDPASRRVRVDTRLKLLAKWFPQRYGDKLEVGTGEGALRVVIGGDA